MSQKVFHVINNKSNNIYVGYFDHIEQKTSKETN